MVGRRLLALWLVGATRGSGNVMSKFTLRNLSGGFVGVWWIDHGGRQLIPQSSVSIRNSSNIEINSFRGHEFVVRRLERKVPLAQIPLDVGPGETILTVGATNDIVVVNADLALVKHDAAYRVRQALERAVEACGGAGACVGEHLGATLETMRAAWLEEEALREAMAADTSALGGDAPALPVPPQGGWPLRLPGAPRDAATLAIAACGGDRPTEPGLVSVFEGSRGAAEALLRAWGEDADAEKCASPEGLALAAHAAAAKADDERLLCGRWAALGECAPRRERDGRAATWRNGAGAEPVVPKSRDVERAAAFPSHGSPAFLCRREERALHAGPLRSGVRAPRRRGVAGASARRRRPGRRARRRRVGRLRRRARRRPRVGLRRRRVRGAERKVAVAARRRTKEGDATSI